MTAVLVVASVFCALICLVHLVSIIAAATGCKARPGTIPAPSADALAVFNDRPVCGIENHIAETLESSFKLDGPKDQVLSCVASPQDPIIPTGPALLCKYPELRAHLLIGDKRISTNPKLSNCVKGWKTAAHDWIAIADSNVLMPRGYIQRLFKPWTEKIGLVRSPPIGGRPQGFWAELECAFLNPDLARAQYCADAIGNGFAQGMFRPNPVPNSSRLCNIH